MKYGSLAHRKIAKLEVIVFRHDPKYEVDGLSFPELVELTSIYKCENMDPYLLHELWDDFGGMFDKAFEKLESGYFYLVSFKLNKNNFVNISKITKLSNSDISKNPEMGLMGK